MARVSKQIRLRAELLAHERGIDQAEIKAACASTPRLIDFARKHKLSIDWLLAGDLRGLQRQTYNYSAARRDARLLA